MFLFAPCVGRDVAFSASFVDAEISVFRLNDTAAQISNVHHALSSLGWQLSAALKVDAFVTRQDAITPLGHGLSVEIDCRDAREFIIETDTGSIKTFVYHHDGSGEGGSGLRFLGPSCNDHQKALVDLLMEKLANQAYIVTDGSNGDFRFRKPRAFSKYGRYWRPVRQAVAKSSTYQATWVWSADRLAPQGEKGYASNKKTVPEAI